MSIVLERGKDSDAWEGLQGTDSFFAYKMGDQWYAFYGTAHTETVPISLWQVGLAWAPSLKGSWKRCSQVNPQKLLALFPTSSVAGSSPGTSLASLNSPKSNNLNRFNPRIDYNLSASDHTFGSFHRQTGRGRIFDLVVGPGGEQDSRSNDYATTLGRAHAFGGNMLNEFRFGYMHRIGDWGGFGQGLTSPSDFGLSGIPNCLSSVPDTSNGTKCGTPGVSINGFNGLSTGSTLYDPASVIQFGDTVSRIVGRHSLKLGTELRHYAIDNYQPNEEDASISKLLDDKIRLPRLVRVVARKKPRSPAIAVNLKEILQGIG